MGWWTSLRDTVEAAAVVAGNYYLPGSSLLTSKLVSDGAQKKLNSKVGRVANIASGGAGGLEGNLGNWGNVASAAGDYTGLSDLFGGSAGGTAGGTSSAVDLGTSSMGGDVSGGASATASPNLSDMTASTSASTPVFTPDTVAQGSNIPTTDYGTGASYGAPAAPGGTGIQASEGVGTSLSLPGSSSTGLSAPSEGYFANASTTGGTSPGFLASMGEGNYMDAAKAAGNYMMDNKMGTAMVGSSLYDMYAKNRMAKRQEDLYNQNRQDILGMYAPGSPEEIAMQREMARKDAAAGRNSQYGIRATDYAGNVAKFRSNALSNLSGNQNALAAAQMGNQYGGLNSMFNNMAMYSLLNKKTT